MEAKNEIVSIGEHDVASVVVARTGWADRLAVKAIPGSEARCDQDTRFAGISRFIRVKQYRPSLMASADIAA